MSRLIDADALKKHYSWWNDRYKEIFDNIIDQQPTIQPVSDIFTENETMRKIIHERVFDGEWETMVDFLDSKRYRCSRCGTKVILNDRNRSGYNFCPNCGADMRGTGYGV